MMDGRDFGPPPRSAHGPPPPLLSGLPMDGHRLAAGRLPPSAPLAAGLPAALQPGKFLASGIGLHAHPGKSAAPRGTPSRARRPA